MFFIFFPIIFIQRLLAFTLIRSDSKKNVKSVESLQIKCEKKYTRQNLKSGVEFSTQVSKRIKLTVWPTSLVVYFDTNNSYLYLIKEWLQCLMKFVKIQLKSFILALFNSYTNSNEKNKSEPLV